MNNCLVTKLKGSVDGNLPKLYELIVPFKEYATSTTIVYPGCPFDVCKSDGTLIAGNQTTNYSLTMSYDGYILFKNTRLMTKLGIAKLDLSDIKFINLSGIQFNGMLSVYGGYDKMSDDIANAVKYANGATNLAINDNDIYGNADCLINNGALTMPNLTNVNAKNNPRLTIHTSVYNTLVTLLGSSYVLFDESQIIED